MREYPYSTQKYAGTLYHIDTWRLQDMSELDDTLHLSELLKPGNLIVMEWAGKAKTYLESHKKECAILMIDIQEKDEQTRLIKYSLSTPEWT
jgi:tRNA A37 threonylcarbamoyladenosine biosynthesis protein TsaE